MVSVCYNFFVWYYFQMSAVLLSAWKNFLLFALNLFSVTVLLKTFFSPWHKYQSDYGRFFEVWKNIETLVFNLTSRIIGAFVRTFLIILGIILIMAVFFIGLIFLIIWIILPLLIIAGFVFGIWLLI
jgi:hypothetical protein